MHYSKTKTRLIFAVLLFGFTIGSGNHLLAQDSKVTAELIKKVEAAIDADSEYLQRYLRTFIKIPNWRSWKPARQES